MKITNSAYLEEIIKLKQAYSDLPWYRSTILITALMNNSLLANESPPYLSAKD